jgi:hypothetical protein
MWGVEREDGEGGGGGRVRGGICTWSNRPGVASRGRGGWGGFGWGLALVV